jgi:hypothetical protein
MKNRRAVEAAIEGVLKEQINLNSRVVPAPSPYATPTAESSLNNLAAEFGGEVVG